MVAAEQLIHSATMPIQGVATSEGHHDEPTQLEPTCKLADIGKPQLRHPPGQCKRALDLRTDTTARPVWFSGRGKVSDAKASAEAIDRLIGKSCSIGTRVAKKQRIR